MAFSLPLPFSVELPPAGALSVADAELIAQLRQGSEVAFRTLVAHYQARVYQTALSLLRSPEEAEDVAQEVFVEVYQTIADFRGEAALRGYPNRQLYQVIRAQAKWSMAR